MYNEPKIYIAKCDKTDYRVTIATSKESVLTNPIKYFQDAWSFPSYTEAINEANSFMNGEIREIVFLGYIDISGYDNHTGGDIFH